MAIRKSSWILVGIFLWGIPLGITVPFLLAFLKPGNLQEFCPFQSSVFIHHLFIFFPLFLILGMCYGLWMYYLGEKIRK